MYSAIELSVRFGIPQVKVKEICDFLGIALVDEAFDVSREFERAARSVKRKRHSAGTLAFVYRLATDEQREFIFALDPDFASEYEECDFPVTDSELLPNAKRLLANLANLANLGSNGSGRSEWLLLAEWVKATATRAARPVPHSYVAVRLLLSLPESDMLDYPAVIASVLNKLRYRGYLNDWFSSIERQGKYAIMYHNPALSGEVENPGLSDEDIARYAASLGTDDPQRLASYIAYATKLDLAKVRKYLEARNKPVANLDL